MRGGQQRRRLRRTRQRTPHPTQVSKCDDVQAGKPVFWRQRHVVIDADGWRVVWSVEAFLVAVCDECVVVRVVCVLLT